MEHGFLLFRTEHILPAKLARMEDKKKKKGLAVNVS